MPFLIELRFLVVTYLGYVQLGHIERSHDAIHQNIQKYSTKQFS